MASAPTAPASVEKPNKVTIADAGPSRKLLTIVIPADTVGDSLGLTMETVMNTAELPGFRKGHVPRRLIEKRFGGAVTKQAKEALISTAYQQAVTDQKLRVLGSPVAPKGKDLDSFELAAGKPFTFEVEVEVLPEFELPKLEGVALKRPLIPVTDELVKSDLDKLAIQEGSLEERQTPEPGDYLTGHATMKTLDGKTHFDSEGIVVQVPPADKKGKGMIVGLVVDDLAGQLGTPKIGQKVTVTTKGPEQHENEALRGHNLVIEYTPARIDRIIPAKAEDLIARFGLADEAALTGALKERIEQRVKVDQSAAMRSQLTKYLLDNVKLDLPERLTADQILRNMERRRMELLYRGVDAVKIEENMAELRNASAFDAVRDLKVFFILDRAAEKFGVTVSEQEVNGRIAQIAMERGERPEKLRQQLMQNNQVSGIYQQIREHKTMDAIIAKADVKEMSIEDYNKMVEADNKAGAEKAKKAQAERAEKADKDKGEKAKKH
jgi:trigger factor